MKMRGQKRFPNLRKSMKRRSRGMSVPGQHAFLVWRSCLESKKRHSVYTERLILKVVFFLCLHEFVKLLFCGHRTLSSNEKNGPGPTKTHPFWNAFPRLSGLSTETVFEDFGNASLALAGQLLGA